ncbi:hydroxymethylglutaryl-CoA lyase [Psychromarinibacter halotolerans]|uniref:Hydroxymethylglutaryl-CoA lyase n=1 Tax=Psychromarinibacter halotolerans TaxID=1775175 RepID=A0ABV7GRR3_9RHOB|nr:hydroxymethylglutaryl-CoA lyase [Psychromarinibacter halotolerans]MDF0596603.1 hydroxymethylglutaryl-CoA lyase [Psychromarinibacter halotolerans]
MAYPDTITISEVGPRDGLQMEKRHLPVDQKLRMIEALAEAGLTRIEATGFVHPKVIPQFADAQEVARALPRRAGLSYAAFVPNRRGAETAVDCGIDELKCGIAASATFNRLNVRMDMDTGMKSLEDIAAATQGSATRIVGVVATAFGCPYEGEVAFETVDRLFSHLEGLGARLIYLADTTGVADPTRVRDRVTALQDRHPGTPVGLHLHNTRGLGLANALTGLDCGVRDFESSIGGLGGCPFAPRAVGNICTEDFVHMAHRMGIATGLDLDRLVAAARLTEDLLDRKLPGMVMKAGPADEIHDPEGQRTKVD